MSLTTDKSLVIYGGASSTSVIPPVISEKKDSPPLKRWGKSEQLHVSIPKEKHESSVASAVFHRDFDSPEGHRKLNRQVKSLPPEVRHKRGPTPVHRVFPHLNETLGKSSTLARVVETEARKAVYENLLTHSKKQIEELLTKLFIATSVKNYPLQMQIGLEIRSLLQKLAQPLGDITFLPFVELGREIRQLIKNTEEQEAFKNYLMDVDVVEDLKNNKSETATNSKLAEAVEKKAGIITQTTDIALKATPLVRKGIYIEALLLRAIEECDKIFSDIAGEASGSSSLVKPSEILLQVKRQLTPLSTIASEVEAPPEFLDYFARLFKAASFPSTNAPVAQSPTTPSTQQPSISAITSLIGVLESELLRLQQDRGEGYIKRTQELIKIRNVLCDSAKDEHLKIALNDQGDSIETILRSGFFKFRSGTSFEARETLIFILNKIAEVDKDNAKTKKISLEIIDLLEKSKWVQTVLNQTSNRDLVTQIDEIRAALTDWKSVAAEIKSRKETSKLVTAANWSTTSIAEEYGNLWSALLDPPTDVAFQKQFLLVYRNVIDKLCSDSGYPSEKLFKLFNTKFAVSGPFQRREILHIAQEWLRNPTVSVNDVFEFQRTSRQIELLIEQAKDTHILALTSAIENLETSLNAYRKLSSEPPSLKKAVSPAQMLKAVADGHSGSYAKEFAETLRQISFYHFSEIRSAEWLKKYFEAQNAPHLSALIAYSTNLTNWIVHTLFSFENPKSIARLMEFFIDVQAILNNELAHSSTNPLDFVSVMAIHAVFEKTYIEKLIYGDKEKSPKLHVDHDRLVSLTQNALLFKLEKNFKNLREKCEKITYFIPPISLLRFDLAKVFDKDVNPLFLDEKLNLSSIENIGKILMQISNQQSATAYSSQEISYHLNEEFVAINSNPHYQKQGFDQGEFDKAMIARAKSL